MSKRSKLTEGMVVFSADGERLGKIVSCQADGFTVEKGLFLPKASTFLYGDVADVRDGAVHLSHERSKLSSESFWSQREGSAASEPPTAKKEERPPLAPSASEAPAPLRPEADEVRVQLAEEEVSADKHIRDIGEVRIRKRVVVSQKQITIPVMHEEVVIERVPLDASSQLATDAFTEASFAVPLHEEELEIHKHPVVREEVRVKRRSLSEDRTASTEVRREELDIEQPEYSPSSPWVAADPSLRH